MNYTVYKALKSIDPGLANTTFSTTLGAVGSAILAVDPDFDNTVDSTIKQIQGAVGSGYNCVELQSGGDTYSAFLAGLKSNTTLSFYEGPDLFYMDSQPNVMRSLQDGPEAGLLVAKKQDLQTSKKPAHKK